MTETSLLEKKDLREQLAGRVEVLDRIKGFFLVPGIECLTARQVADFYRVEYKSIEKCYQRNKAEIDLDGVKILTISDMANQTKCLISSKTTGSVTFQVADNITLTIPNRGIKSFSKRAILRIGMLLRDSEVAKEVRTQLLNTFENATVEQKVVSIDDEQKLLADLGLSFASGDINEFAKATMAYNQFKDRHITQLQHDNKVLAAQILEWDDRSSINKAMRVIATKLNIPFGYPWKWLYDELRYKHNIGLSNRGKNPYIQWVREDEWPLVQQSLCAICEDKGLSPSKVMAAAKLLNDKDVAN